MITRSKIKQLEEKFKHKQKGKSAFIWRDVLEDGRLLDKDGYVMTDEEVNQIEKEDKGIRARGDMIAVEVSCEEPKLKPDSATKPYHVSSYKGDSSRHTNPV